MPPQKVAGLGKQLDVTPSGWQEAAGPYGEAGSHRSIPDVVDAASRAKVRAYKQQASARHGSSVRAGSARRSGWDTRGLAGRGGVATIGVAHWNPAPA